MATRSPSPASEGIADVLQAQGDLVGALTSSRDSLAILKTLVAKDPGNAEWQRDVSVSDNDVGDLLQAQGDPGRRACQLSRQPGDSTTAI